MNKTMNKNTLTVFMSTCEAMEEFKTLNYIDSKHLSVDGKPRVYWRTKNNRIAFRYNSNMYVISDPQNIAYISVEVSAEHEANEDIIANKVTEFSKIGSQDSVDGIVRHYQYTTIKACVSADIPVYLYGPAGTGKNFTLQQIAEDEGLEFYFTNSVQQEYKLTGFIDAGGVYHETEFYKAFTNGGLFFLDEMDASIPEVLVLLNAAIANRYFEFPNGRVNAHPDFRVVAAGNTVGSGADELYTGRLVLDQATLDRFVTIEFGYDKNIEFSLAKGNMELVEFIHSLREKAERTGVRATFSYRCIISVQKLESAGLPLKQIITIAVFKGMDEDTINSLTDCASRNKYMMSAK